jgi:hypothetical protein
VTAPSGRLTGAVFNTLALTDTGQLLIAGATGAVIPDSHNQPDTYVATWTAVADNIAGAGIYTDLVLGYDTTGRLYGLGCHHRLGIGDNDTTWTALGLDGIAAVAADVPGNVYFALDTNGNLHGIAAGRATSNYANAPGGLWGHLISNIAGIDACGRGAAALTRDGRIVARGYNASNRFGAAGGNNDPNQWHDLGIDNITSIHLGYNSLYALDTDHQLHFLGLAPDTSRTANSWYTADITDVTGVTTDSTGAAYVLHGNNHISVRGPASWNSAPNAAWNHTGIDGGHTVVRNIQHTGDILIANTDDGPYIRGNDRFGALGYGATNFTPWLRLPTDDTVHTVFSALVRDGHNPHQALATANALHT